METPIVPPKDYHEPLSNKELDLLEELYRYEMNHTINASLALVFKQVRELIRDG